MARDELLVFDLPDAIQGVIPDDPYEQLDIARRITIMAIGARVSRLESEASRLRRSVSDRDAAAAGLRDQIARLQRLVNGSEARLSATLEENAKLAQERMELQATARKLARNLAKLETFKKQLLQSLDSDGQNQHAEGAADIDGNSTSKITSLKDDTSSNRIVPDTGGASSALTVAPQDGYYFSLTPYITPRLTPNSTPKITSQSGSPRALVMAGSSPRKSNSEGYTTSSRRYSSNHPPSLPSAATNSHSTSGRTRIDGKEFFRQARTRLSYEQFGAFLANLKEFNGQTQSAEETLAKAEEIFGLENKDLFISFQNMLVHGKR